MKPLLFVLQVIFFIAFLGFFYLTLAEVFKFSTPFAKFNHKTPVYDGWEAYDPSLIRLNTMDKVEDYSDSLYKSKFGEINLRDSAFPEKYASIINKIVRNKFYHGYSSYGFSDNYMALMMEPMFNKWLSAVVLPNDIVKHPYAACSQQSLVMMRLFGEKGISTRKVGFDGGSKYGGHFCFEALYNGKWHFFDPDKEPDAKLLDSLGRPDIATLAGNDSLLIFAYRELVADNARALFKNYFYGQPDVEEAPQASIYQHVTKILSYIFWIFPLIIFILIRRKYLRLQA